MKLEQVSKELSERIRTDRLSGNTPCYAAVSSAAIRRDMTADAETVWRPAYVRDVDKIMHSPYYNRYSDKTQVFSFYKNDDISHRALHVQLVSRIARTIGSALCLNTDLIEAIALGHDIGHAPFGHAGERYISEVYFENTGRYFNHNIHSARVLDGIFPLNLTLDTLDGIIAHNGEFEQSEYSPEPLSDFAVFDRLVEGCYCNEKENMALVPSTLEGCVVRIADIIAYLGKDRQDAARMMPFDLRAVSGETVNAGIINNLVVNIIEHSYARPYIRMDAEHYEWLKKAKQINYYSIYRKPEITRMLDGTVRPVMQQLYARLLSDLKAGKKDSPIFRHHIDFVTENHYAPTVSYLETEPNQIVVDYLASMTDSYCSELYRFMFPRSTVRFPWHGYFEDLT